MNPSYQIHTFDLNSTQSKVLINIQYRAVALLGRLRILKDGSIEVEDQWAQHALEALANDIASSMPKQAISETEQRSGMPWSVYIGHCLSWWEGIGQPQQSGSMCMPRGLTPAQDSEHIPSIKCAETQVNTDGQAHGFLQQNSNGLSTWTPISEQQEPQEIRPISRSRPPIPYLPFFSRSHRTIRQFIHIF